MSDQQKDGQQDRSWMIAEVSVVPGVRDVVVFSVDGLLLAGSPGLGRDRAERLAATCSGLQSLGRALGQEFGTGDGLVRHQMIEFDGGFLFLRSADGAHLAVVADPVVDPRQVARAMQAQVLKIGAANLSSPARREPIL